MDAQLKQLAEVGLQLSAAEEALDAGAHTGAREQLDEAAEGLEALRGAWAGLSDAERTVVGPAAVTLRARLDAATARLPRRSALTEVPAEPGEDDADDEPPA